MNCNAELQFLESHIPSCTSKSKGALWKSSEKWMMILCLTNRANLAVRHWGRLRLHSGSGLPGCGSDHISHKQSVHCDGPTAQPPLHCIPQSGLAFYWQRHIHCLIEIGHSPLLQTITAIKWMLVNQTKGTEFKMLRSQQNYHSGSPLRDGSNVPETICLIISVYL